MTDLSEADRLHSHGGRRSPSSPSSANSCEPDKMNLASLGNLVPHLHWHVIPRFENDPHLSAAIWAAPATSAQPR